VKELCVFRGDDVAVGTIAQARGKKTKRLLGRQTGITGPGYNAKDDVSWFGGIGRNSSEDSKAKLPVVRTLEKKLGLANNAIIDERAHDARSRIAIARIDEPGNENRFVVDVLPGRGGFDYDFRRDRHGVRSHLFPRDQSSAIFRDDAGKTCGILKGRR
jgi:hypothetical protein